MGAYVDAQGNLRHGTQLLGTGCKISRVDNIKSMENVGIHYKCERIMYPFDPKKIKQ